MTDHEISEEAGVKNKEPVTKNTIHSSKSYLKRISPPKSVGIQLKTGAVFCLPAKSSHSSRIIIPNKRFLEDDYHMFETSPKKPKVEQLSADTNKQNAVTVPSTYRCSLGTKKQIKSDSTAAASDVPCKPESGVEDDKFESNQTKAYTSDVGVVEFESNQTKLCTSDVDDQDLKPGDKSSELKSEIVQPVERDSLKSQSVSPVGSILQRPKLCLDQTAVDRSKEEFAKSLGNQMAQESSSKLPDTPHHVTSPSATGDVTNSVLIHSVNSSTQSTNNAPSVTFSSWTSRTGNCYKLLQSFVVKHGALTPLSSMF